MSRLSKSSHQLALPVFLSLMALSMPFSAMAANAALPSPYVSHALDAVLIPINADVRTAFSLDADQAGVLVLAVQPGGVAEANGIEPGDVIEIVKGHKISEPIQLDEVVYYWLTANDFDFVFDGWRAGQIYSISSMITMESYLEVIDVTSIESWSSYSSESFSYSEYYAEYSSEISESYASSESTVEETATSEEFAADISDDSEMAATDAGSAATDSDGDGTVDAVDTDDDNDGIDDSADPDDNNDGIDDAASDDTSDADTDSDGDGTLDAVDTDDDNDGIDDSADSDDNGDGVDE